METPFLGWSYTEIMKVNLYIFNIRGSISDEIKF